MRILLAVIAAAHLAGCGRVAGQCPEVTEAKVLAGTYTVTSTPGRTLVVGTDGRVVDSFERGGKRYEVTYRLRGRELTDPR